MKAMVDYFCTTIEKTAWMCPCSQQESNLAQRFSYEITMIDYETILFLDLVSHGNI